MYFGDHRKDLGLLATSFVHLVPIQQLFVRVVPIQHLFPCDHNPQSRGITGLLDMKRLLFAQMGRGTIQWVPLPVVKYNGVPLPFTGLLDMKRELFAQMGRGKIQSFTVQKGHKTVSIHNGAELTLLFVPARNTARARQKGWGP